MADFSVRADRKIAPYFITAPGVSIDSFVPLSRDSKGKGTKSGTSMAAPLVAGAITRLACEFPQLSVDEISAIARNTATPQFNLGGVHDVSFGKGLFNMETARERAYDMALLNTAEMELMDYSGAEDVKTVKTKTSKFSNKIKNIRMFKRHS